MIFEALPFKSALIDLTSKWNFPAHPSAMISIDFNALRCLASGHTDGSSEHLTVGSPVVSFHLYENASKGTLIVCQSLDTEMLKSACIGSQRRGLAKDQSLPSILHRERNCAQRVAMHGLLKCQEIEHS